LTLLLGKSVSPAFEEQEACSAGVYGTDFRFEAGTNR